MNASGVATSDAVEKGRPLRAYLTGRENLLGCKHQNIVHCSSLIFHLSLWNGAARAMTNEKSTMNNEQ
jgi:hypothetical protein